MKKSFKYISWIIIIAVITYHLPKNILAATTYNYNDSKVSQHSADWLDFEKSKFSLAGQGQEIKIIHQWGYSVTNGNTSYKYTQEYSVASEDYLRTYSKDPIEVKFFDKEKNLAKIKLRVYRFTDPNLPSFAKNFGLLVENVNNNTQFIVGMFYIDENKDTWKDDCYRTRLGKIVVQSSPDLMEAEVQGDSSSKGLCAYKPNRVRQDANLFPESKDAQDIFYYIFHLNSYIRQNAPILGNIESDNSFLQLNPTEEQKKKCNKTANDFYLTKPLTSYGEDGIHDEIILKMRDMLKSYSDDSKVHAEISKRIQNIDYTAEDDKKLFEQYYRSNSSHNFPDQLMDASYALNFQDLYNKAEIDKVIAEYNAGYKIFIEHADTAATVGGATIAGSALKVGVTKAAEHLGTALAGGTAATAAAAEAAVVAGTAAPVVLASDIVINGAVYAAGTTIPASLAAQAGLAPAVAAPVAASGSAIGAFAASVFTPIVIAIVVIVAAYLIWVAWKAWKLNKSIDQYFKSLFMVTMAWYYAQQNKAYQECAGSWSDEKYSGQQEYYSKISLLKNQTDTQAKEAMGIIFEDNICPEAKVWAASSWFRASLCGIGVALWRAGKSLMDFSMEQLAVVLGTRYTRGY